MLLPPYLSALGLGATQIGVILFGTLFGSALVTHGPVSPANASDGEDCFWVRAL